MKNLRIGVFGLLWTFFASCVAFEEVLAVSYVDTCTAADFGVEDAWDYPYQPNDPKIFAKQVQSLVEQKDLQGLFALVDGELSNGPRKSFLVDKSFDEVFDDYWVAEVLNEPIPCGPTDWRGFMLGNGLIQFDYRDGKWVILIIYNTMLVETPDESLPIGWRVDGRLLSGECFSTLWLSNDNYEAYETLFDISNFNDFSMNVGMYFGREITTLEPVVPTWCGMMCEEDPSNHISLARPVGPCLSEEGELEVRVRFVATKLKEFEPDYNIETRYEIIGAVDKEACESLAPSLGGECKESYLISIGDYGGGGSMGPIVTHNIYGHFELDDDRNMIVPLKNFRNRNEALNFVDGLAQDE